MQENGARPHRLAPFSFWRVGGRFHLLVLVTMLPIKCRKSRFEGQFLPDGFQVLPMLWWRGKLIELRGSPDRMQWRYFFGEARPFFVYQ